MSTPGTYPRICKALALAGRKAIAGVQGRCAWVAGAAEALEARLQLLGAGTLAGAGRLASLYSEVVTKSAAARTASSLMAGRAKLPDLISRLHALGLTRRQQLLVLVALFGLLTASTFMVVGHFTRQMLQAEAQSAARSWAQFIVANVPDLSRIMNGERMSPRSIRSLDEARTVGNVFRYKLFDRSGMLRMNSDEKGPPSPATLEAEHPGFLAEVLRGNMRMFGRRGRAAGEPGFIAEAYMPIREGGAIIGVIGIYVDQTGKLQLVYSVLAEVVASLAIILSLAFGIPGAAFWLRTRQKEIAEAKLSFLVLHDALTGLPNRTSFIAKLEAAFAAQQSEPALAALHYIDLDRFKSVNDTLGQSAGDQLLREAAARINAHLGLGDIAARVGGDEFVIMQSGMSRPDAANDLAAQLLRSLGRPFELRGQRLTVTPSIGTALAPLDATTPDALVKAADLALYFAKRDGGACHRQFDVTMRETIERRRVLESQVRRACETGGFVLHYQPVVDLRTRDLIGFEALLRMHGGDGSLVPPSEFIPVAEEIGLIKRIGAWVMEEACRNAALWPEPLRVAVNLSPAQFLDGEIVGNVRQALMASGLKPQRLEIEVTEGVLVKDAEQTRRQLEEMRALGVSIVLDDFGTGYSSLSYLWQFQFDKIKIDQTFVRALGASSNVPGIVRTIVALGRMLNMVVTAEGVETAEQAALLQALHCDQAQGYLYGRPVPLSEVTVIIMKAFAASLQSSDEAGFERSLTDGLGRS